MGTTSIAIGNEAGAGGDAAIALGNRTLADGEACIAIGDECTASGAGCIAIGILAQAAGAAGIALGAGAISEGTVICIGSPMNEGLFLYGITPAVTTNAVGVLSILDAPDFETPIIVAGPLALASIAFDAESDLEKSGAELMSTYEFKRSQTDKFMALRPVAYKTTRGQRELDFALIAPEDPQDFWPEMMISPENSGIRLDKGTIMLIDEIQKNHRALEDQQQQINKLQQELDELKIRLK